MDDFMVTRRRARQNEIDFLCYTSQLEPKNVEEALVDESWITTLQEELNQFVRNDVWYLVPRLKDKHVIKTFASVIRIVFIRILIVITCSLKMTLFQMDVQIFFQNGVLSEKVYVEQPKGFKDPKYPNHVYRLKKVIYDLKQAPRTWYKRLTSYILEKDFERKRVDHTLFIRRTKS
ncbi:hypothetical protein AAG906_006918 [Vitis piasezkii]